jgi:flagellar export protein FliJ
MKRFVWRLQKVLDVRAKQEEIKRIELVRLTEKLAERQSELLMCQRVLQDIIDGISRDSSSRRLTAQEFFLKQAVTNDERIRALKKEIVELEVRQNEKTAELLAVRRSREALERLRAEAREQFIREQERLEQKELDDGSIMAFARKESMKG